MPSHDDAGAPRPVPVYRVELQVCELCLVGEGEECHVPECAFCFRDVPDEELREVLNVGR